MAIFKSNNDRIIRADGHVISFKSGTADIKDEKAAEWLRSKIQKKEVKGISEQAQQEESETTKTKSGTQKNKT